MTTARYDGSNAFPEIASRAAPLGDPQFKIATFIIAKVSVDEKTVE